jgi:hypothetical protein
MPSPYSTLTAVTPTTGQVKASDFAQMATAQPNQPQGLLAAPQHLDSNTGTTTFAGSSPVSSFATTTLSYTLTIPANRRIRLGWDGFVGSSVSTDTVFVFLIKDGAAVELAIAQAATAVGFVFEETPAAGSHTYDIRFSRNAGTGAVYLYGGSFNSGLQAQFYIEDVGAA